jgi:phenylpropionate dioxygenase-like ring-hydroxylating dioxygenase large terminal subunit
LDAQDQPAAFKDRCCHRTAKLSKGACHNGHLQCGYHGGRYNRAGQVVVIPQYDHQRKISSDYCTKAYACMARYGYAWVALEEPIVDIL